ncbi:MAG: tetratricopeptide repeat protein [Deltaproteobacteria bacterium]|nr:tetratricopeptide repeat protein [Deltaproteobacteria bacterium]MBW2667617.1 tetratricopeptide repeat protein [Deltaproteobacteria bacterium]
MMKRSRNTIKKRCHGLRLAGTLALGLLVALGGVTAAFDDAHAQEKKSAKQKKKEKEERKNFAAGEWAYKKLNAALEAMDEERYADALDVLNDMTKRKSLSKFEKASMYQTFAFVYSSQGKYKQAIPYFEKCLAQDSMPEAAARQTEYNLGQLYMSQERYRDALKILEPWLKKADNPSASAYYLVGMAHVQLEDAKTALPFARMAVKKSKKPRQSYLQMALALEFENKNFKHVARLLEVLITYFPKKSYYLQLSSVYAQLGKDKKSLSAMELAYLQDMLTTENELVRLSQAYLYHEIPYKAAHVLEKGIENKQIEANAKNLQSLGDAWLHARELEKALDPLKQSAAKSGDGNLFVRIAQVHLERGENSKAVAALQKGLAKGGLDDPGNAYLLVGIAHSTEKRFGPARDAFAKAGNYEKSRTAAAQWTRHVEQQESIQ